VWLAYLALSGLPNPASQDSQDIRREQTATSGAEQINRTLRGDYQTVDKRQIYADGNKSVSNTVVEYLDSGLMKNCSGRLFVMIVKRSRLKSIRKALRFPLYIESCEKCNLLAFSSPFVACQCGCGNGEFLRHYQTRAEQISELQEYLNER